MATTSETDGERTEWTVTTSDGEARIERRNQWAHYVVTCRGATRLVQGDDFARAHDVALGLLRATRVEQPEPDGWEESEPDVWTLGVVRYDSCYDATVCRVDAERDPTTGALVGGRWAWHTVRASCGTEHEGECATLAEAKRAAEAAMVAPTAPPLRVSYADGREAVIEETAAGWAWTLLRGSVVVGAGEAETRDDARRAADEWAASLAARCESEPLAGIGAAGVGPRRSPPDEQPDPTAWRQNGGGQWVREIGLIRVVANTRLSGTWWAAHAMLSRFEREDVQIAGGGASIAADARAQADEWLRAHGVVR